MASVRPRGELIRISLGREEAALLVSLASQVAALLRGEDAQGPDTQGGDESSFEQLVAGLDAGPPPPQGPILERLLPAGYRDDPEAAEEFRRLTDGELRATKGRALQRMLDDVATAGGLASGKTLKIDLEADAAESWLHAINDVRLALGTHLDIREEVQSEQRANALDEQERDSYAIYDWLTWLQESIVRPMLGG